MLEYYGFERGLTGYFHFSIYNLTQNYHNDRIICIDKNIKRRKSMVCPKCHSEDVRTQVINEVSIKNAHHGILWWLFVGFWWVPLKWLIFTIPALILKLFGRKKQKVVNKQKTVCVCQHCGYTWEI